MCITSDVDRTYELPIAKVEKYKCINCRFELFAYEKQCYNCSFNIINFRHDLNQLVNDSNIYINALEHYNFHEVSIKNKNISKIDKVCVVCSKISKFDKTCPHCKFNLTLFYNYCKVICKCENREINKVIRALQYNI